MAMTALTLARLLLAAMFAVAGAAKLADLRGSQAALRGFAVPRVLAGILGVLLPLAELAIAGALVPGATARPAALAASALLLAFTAAIGVALVRGRKPDCHCFGQLHSAPAGWTTLARNAVLAGLAIVIVSQPTSSAGALELAVFAVVAIVAGHAVLSYKLLCRHGQALQRIAELEAGVPEPQTLEVGTAAPGFALPAVGGGEVSLDGLLGRSRPALLVFSDPGCGPCHALLPDLTRWQHEHREQLMVALVSRGDENENAALAEEHELETVLVQEDREIADLYGADATPSAVLVGVDGRIAAPLQYGHDGVQAVLVRALEPSPKHSRTASRVAAVGAVAAAGASIAAPALGAPVDDEDDAIRELKRILRAHDPELRREAQRVAARTRRLFKAPRSASVKFELVAAIALAKKEIRWTKDELEAVPVPDYRPGEKGARIAKSRATSSLAYLDLVLDRYAKATQTSDVSKLERLHAEIVRFTIEAEKNRRLASKKLGCTRKLEDC